MYADLAPDNTALRDVTEKTGDPADKRSLVQAQVEAHDFSERRVCQLVGLSRCMARHERRPDREP
jgi:hypothetical protein